MLLWFFALHLIFAMAKHLLVSLSDDIDELHLLRSKVLVTPLLKNLSNLWQTTNTHNIILFLHTNNVVRIINKKLYLRDTDWVFGSILTQLDNLPLIWCTILQKIKINFSCYKSTNLGTISCYTSIYKWSRKLLTIISCKETLTGDLGKISPSSFL